jgi:hypothetical protein
LKSEENDPAEDVDVVEAERIDREEEIDDESVHVEWAGYI